MAEFAPTVERLTTQQFLIMALDGPDSQPMREKHLEAHLHHIEKHVDRYVACGPLHNGDPTQLYGSFFLVLAQSREDARSLLDGDPYLHCGMYEQIDVHPATVAAGTALGGGVIWESAAALLARQNPAK
ncbi:MAG: YciI family protein [Gammaproteobacteria bacterium]